MHIREIRFWKRINQRMITQRTGIGSYRLTCIENGYDKATDEEKRKLAEAVGVPVEQIEFDPPEGLDT